MNVHFLAPRVIAPASLNEVYGVREYHSMAKSGPVKLLYVGTRCGNGTVVAKMFQSKHIWNIQLFLA